MIEWTAGTAATAVATAGTNATYNVRNTTNSNIASITGTGSTKFIYANNGAYGSAGNRQDLWVTLGAGTSSTNGWIGGHTTGDLYGDIHLRLAEGAIGKSTVFGVVNAGTVHGDIYPEFLLIHRGLRYFLHHRRSGPHLRGGLLCLRRERGHHHGVQ